MLIEKNNFITHEDCDELIRISENNFGEAQVLGSEKGYRVAYSTWLDSNEEISIKLKNITSIETVLPVSNMEMINIVRYEVGGEYKAHHDFFNTVNNMNYNSTGGQRVKTVLFYLNDDFEGGQTDFSILNIRVDPVKSKVIIWDNIKEDGSLDYDSIHAGLPVTKGIKYIAIIWIRENVNFYQVPVDSDTHYVKEDTELNYYDVLGF